jgi:glucan biosynthesis protein C
MTTGTSHEPARPLRDASLVSRNVYVDHLKGFLCVLVILHHVLITYGAEGSWFYLERTNRPILNLVLTTICAFNQFYFMGFFFLLAAFFVPGSVDRKGPSDFFKKRLFHLGIPLVGWVILLAPPLEFRAWRAGGYRGGFWDFLQVSPPILKTFPPGPLWFVEALLIFSALYLLFHRFNPPSRQSFVIGPRHLVICGAAVWLGSFLVRLKFPIGAEFAHLQLAFFPQYIVLFFAGTWLARRNGPEAIPTTFFWPCAIAALVGFVLIPVTVFSALRDRALVPQLVGGPYWPAAALEAVEALICPTAIVALLVFFRERLNRTMPVWTFLGRNSFGAYVIHAPVVVSLSMLIHQLTWHPLVKLIFVGTLGIAGSFAFSELVLRRVPGVRAVFR